MQKLSLSIATDGLVLDLHYSETIYIYMFMRSNDSSLKGKIFLFYQVSLNNLYRRSSAKPNLKDFEQSKFRRDSFPVEVG